MPSPRHPQTPPTGNHGAQAADALIAVAPLINRWIERLLATASPSLTPTQFLTLRGVANGVESSAQLARSAGVSSPAVSQLVANLVQAGLLERSEFAGDRRRLSLRLSTLGEQRLAAANTMLRTELSRLLGELPPHEADALADALASVAAELAGVNLPRRPRPKPPIGPGPKPGPRTGPRVSGNRDPGRDD